MDRETFEREASAHREVYEANRERIRRLYPGKYVVLARRKVFAVADTFDEAQQEVERELPDSEFVLIFPTEVEPSFELSYDL